MIFALSISAQKLIPEGVQEERLPAATRNARSEAEAVGLGIGMSKVQWPTKEGWYNHSATAVEIPRDWIVLETRA